MLNLDITQDNLYLLLAGKTGRVACMLAEDEKIQLSDAILRVYCSQTYSALEQEATKAWHLGPVALYETLREERS